MGSPALSKSSKICSVRSSSEILQSSIVGSAEGADVIFEEGNWVRVEESSKKSSSAKSSSVILEIVGVNDGENEGYGDTVEFSKENSLNSNVGSSEGLSVPTLVGSSEGFWVRTKVGSSDILSVGTIVGPLEVFSVGALDGFVEGRLLGAKEGFTEGMWLGGVLGSKVGVVEIEGKEEGSKLSFFVGTRDKEGTVDTTLVGSSEWT